MFRPRPFATVVIHQMYCLNGHYIESVPSAATADWEDALDLAHREATGYNPPAFCPTCGAKTMNACKKCKAPIRALTPFGGRSSYCGSCGKAFPWTETALRAAREYTDEIEGMSDADKITLKASFDHLTVDTPETHWPSRASSESPNHSASPYSRP